MKVTKNRRGKMTVMPVSYFVVMLSAHLVLSVGYRVLSDAKTIGNVAVEIVPQRYHDRTQAESGRQPGTKPGEESIFDATLRIYPDEVIEPVREQTDRDKRTADEQRKIETNESHASIIPSGNRN